jgi:putative methionine-R-sulfoxide reductase with GAF domain
MITFIVDPANKLIAHPDTKLTENVAELVDFGSYPPVAALRVGKTGAYEFTDDQGEEWLAYLSVMENGWGIVTQQNKTVALLPLTMNRRLSWGVMIAGSLLLLTSAYIMLRYALRPVNELTETVAAIAAGDHSREVRVTRDDEIGQLARAFNIMNTQIRDNIANLERRVTERTRALSLSADVSRRVSTILDLDQLTSEVVNQLKQAFNYYHTHIYLFDDSHENLVMMGGSGEAGQIMQARGHKIQRGKGLVGRAAASNTSVLVADTLQDPGWLPNPLLPETRSELAVPISIGDRVIGVLDVQQNVVGGLTSEDKDLIESIANQVAVAVQNARAYDQVRKQARHESLVSKINQRIQRAVTIDEVLQIAVSELGRGLDAQRASVEVRSHNGSTGRKV